MESYDPKELIEEHKEEQRSRGELASQALEWFLEDENVGQLYPRDGCVGELSKHLGVSPERANVSISDTVGDIVDPVQQIVKGRQKYVGVIEYKVFSDEGAYGYVDFNDVQGRRKRVVCARCVEKYEHDNDVVHATQGEGSSKLDASWQQLLNKVTGHYADSHTEIPSDIEPGASLLSGTTISGNTAFHKGNDGAGSGLDADTVRGNAPSLVASGTGIGSNEFDPTVVTPADGNLILQRVEEQFNFPGVIYTGNEPAFWALQGDNNGVDYEIYTL